MAKHVDLKLTTDFRFEELLSTNPKMREDLEYAVDVILKDAREQASEEMKRYFFDSAHETHRAIRRIVYKKVIGGELNILNVKRALRQGKVSPSYRGRTADTQRILSYTGIDRGFILRFVNDGTNERWTKNMNGKPMKRQDVDERPAHRHYVYPYMLGGRGGAAKKNGRTLDMFYKAGSRQMTNAAMQLQTYIDQIIEKRLKSI